MVCTEYSLDSVPLCGKSGNSVLTGIEPEKIKICRRNEKLPLIQCYTTACTVMAGKSGNFAVCHGISFLLT